MNEVQNMISFPSYISEIYKKKEERKKLQRVFEVEKRKRKEKRKKKKERRKDKDFISLIYILIYVIFFFISIDERIFEDQINCWIKNCEILLLNSETKRMTCDRL